MDVASASLDRAMSRAFKEQGIEIPFPQCDLHIHSGVLAIKTATDS
jgi:small-conductance mechanosensitive channel